MDDAVDQKKSAVCRVCLKCDINSEKGFSLFEKYNNIVISDKINALANVGIEEGDGLPDMICSTCLLDLENAYSFKLKCENTNETLLSAINDAAQHEDLDIPVKEEYLTDDDFEYLDDNITLNNFKQATQITQNIDLACSATQEIDLACNTTQEIDLACNEQSASSRAIDLKLECHDCGGSFKSKCKLRVHWKKVHMAEKLKCSNCLRKFKTYAAYNSHKKRDLKSCKVAGMVRIEGEGRNRIFHCKDCNYHSKRIKDISSHIMIHSGERPYQCDICFRSFTQQSSLQSHKERAHKIFYVEGTCQFCGKHIQGRSKFYSHLKQHSAKVLSCKICNATLKNKNSLLQHMKRHSGVKGYACESCPTTFYTSSELYNHKTKVHLKSRIYKCDICGYTSFNAAVIKKHRPKHSASNVACRKCGMFFENEQQLILHKKRHTDRNHRCIHCDKTYFSRKNLSSHIRKVHKIVKLINHKDIGKVDIVKSECFS